MTNVALYNSFEGGTNGTTISAVNSGGTSGDNFGVITGTPKFSNAQSRRGLLCADCSSGAGATAANVQYGTNTLSNAGIDFWVRFYAYQTAAPVTTNTYIFIMNDDGAPVRAMALRVTASTGAWGFYNSAGTLYAGTAGSVVVPNNQWFRFDMRLNGSTTSGTIEAFFYTGADLENPIGGKFTDHVLATGLAISGSGNLSRPRYGTSGTVATNYTIFYDDVAYSETTWIGSSAPQVDPNRPMLIRFPRLPNALFVPQDWLKGTDVVQTGVPYTDTDTVGLTLEPSGTDVQTAGTLPSRKPTLIIPNW